MYLATVLPGFCTMAVGTGLDSGLVAPYNKRFSLAAVSADGRSFAYVTPRPAAEGFFEYGVHALGEGAGGFAGVVAERLREWDRSHREGPGPVITVYPEGTADDLIPERLGGRVIDKVHSRVAVSWPAVGGPG